MSKLQEYRDKKNEETNLPPLQLFKAGFNTALALNLPVRFIEWVKEKWSSGKLGLGKYYHVMDGKQYSDKELYQYWLDNVFKLE